MAWVRAFQKCIFYRFFGHIFAKLSAIKLDFVDSKSIGIRAFPFFPMMYLLSYLIIKNGI